MRAVGGLLNDNRVSENDCRDEVNLHEADGVVQCGNGDLVGCLNYG